MKFYLKEKYSIYGTSYYEIYRDDGICYGASTSPWEYLRDIKLCKGVKFKIIEKPLNIAQQPLHAIKTVHIRKRCRK